MRLALLAKRHSIHSVRWANALAERGYEVHFFSAERQGEPVAPSVTVHFLPVAPPLGFYANAPALRRLLRRIGPDLMNAHFASGYGTLARLSGFRPTVLSVWGSDVFDFPRKSPLHARLIAANLRSADAVTSTSEVMARQTRSLAALRAVTVVPFGIDTERFACRPQYHRSEKTTVTIGTVKTLAPKYGIDTLLRAFALLKQRLESEQDGLAAQLRLLVVGGGPSAAELTGLAASLGIKELTTFAGQIDHTEVPSRLSELDVYVALSRLDSESFGVAVLEASAMCLPVVVSDAGGLPEVVTAGVTGLVVPRDDPGAAAESLYRLVLDPALRRSMGAAGRQHVLDNYTWSASVDRMEDVYRSVLASRASGAANGANGGPP